MSWRSISKPLWIMLLLCISLNLGCPTRRAAAPSISEPPPTTLDQQEFMDILVVALEAKDEIEQRTELPLEVNDLVIIELANYLRPGSTQIAVGAERLPEFQELAEPILEDEGVPRELIYLAFVESHFNPEAVSPSGAVGAWQFMKGTAKHMGLRVDRTCDQRKDIQASTRAAARYLKSLYETFGDWYLALAAYNAGPGTIERVLGRYGFDDYWDLCSPEVPIKNEAKRYVPRFIAAVLIFEAPEKFGFVR